MEWNIFRYLADFSHLISIIILYYSMFKKKSCAGVSLRTHILYLSVYLCRYVNSNLFNPPVYNIIFKLFYISSSIGVIALLLTKFNATYEKRHDSFRIIYIYILCVFPALIAEWGSFSRILVAYSLWLEAFAILPQIVLITRTIKVDIMNYNYIFFLSIYRLFYLLNWLYDTLRGISGRSANIWITGIIQTLIYSDFIYVYLKMRYTGSEFELPY